MIPCFWTSNLVNPLLFGEMGQMGETETKWRGENLESVWSFLFPPLPSTLFQSISAYPFALFPHVTKDCDSGEQNALAVGPLALPQLPPGRQ